MHCPICQSNNQQRLLSLARTPIYQHPLDAEIEVPLPHHVDLDYLFCETCGHAFQAEFDGALMDQIYANHYYTPAPDDIGHQFRDEFFTDIDLCDANGKNVMLLGLDVLPEYRGQGLARELVYRYSQREKANGRKKLFLTCLEQKVEMYKKFGLQDLGIADSTWGGEEWHEMVLKV